MKKLKIDWKHAVTNGFHTTTFYILSVIFSKFSNYYEFLVRYKKIDTLLTEMNLKMSFSFQGK